MPIMLDSLMPLIGTWSGKGIATYPTMEDVEYSEQLVFQPDEKNSLIQYEQKTRRTANNAQSHWELGFIRPLEDGTIEWLNVQNGGRVEVLKGQVQTDGDRTKLVLKSTLYGNDERMIESTREVIVESDSLYYEVIMATQSTPELTQHLEANLTREA